MLLVVPASIVPGFICSKLIFSKQINDDDDIDMH